MKTKTRAKNIVKLSLLPPTVITINDPFLSYTNVLNCPPFWLFLPCQYLGTMKGPLIIPCANIGHRLVVWRHNSVLICSSFHRLNAGKIFLRSDDLRSCMLPKNKTIPFFAVDNSTLLLLCVCFYRAVNFNKWLG